MKNLNKFILEQINSSISDEELQFLIDEYNKQYKGNKKFDKSKIIDLYKNTALKGNKSVNTSCWITFMNDPNNNAKHIEPYFCGVITQYAYVSHKTNMQFFEISAINKTNNIDKNIKKYLIEKIDDVINELNIKTVNKDNLLKFIESV